MPSKNDECVGCKIFEEEKQAALKRYNSVFDAVSYMWSFTDKCKKNCKKNSN